MQRSLQDETLVIRGTDSHAMQEPSQPSRIAELLTGRIADAARPLSPAALRVVRYLERNPGLAVTASAADLAREMGLSDATVIRSVQALGFQGMDDLRRSLAAILEGGSPAVRMRQTLRETGEDPGVAIDVALDAHQEALTRLRSAPMRETLVAAVNLLGSAERIAVFGIGPSAMLARYTSVLLVRSGRQAVCLDATGIALADQLLGLRSGDALLLLAYGSAYPEVTATIGRARQQRLPMVLVTDSLESRLARHADVIVPAQRGRAERVALHGATLVVLEALVLGLAATDRSRTLEALEQLNMLREAISGTRRFDV
jgi:DNA-binding MurR/RpiR family transcriptional regulator